ncbi:YybH family protein [Paludisphaera rhizosphaerae]|uniref:YybH family protein n=1 Tax=Paludisphaera rhizosphaerae TaxID=2711216 RepID=UPI0013EA3156|nr:SgcJ/EcaC family oxidoreductase [Paludisphaera rhizosphaerae]
MFRIATALMLAGVFPLGIARSLAAEEAPAAQGETDRRAIEAVVAEFVRAFNAGDAAAVAALFTEGARIETEGSPAIEGRAAIQKLFAERFAADPGRTIVVKTEHLRLLGADAALEEGSAVVATSGAGDNPEDAVRYQYSASYVRKDGKWLQDCIHDYPASSPDADKSPRDHLADLAWLIGEWLDEDDSARVETSCDWAEDGAFLTRKFQVKVGSDVVMKGVQRIGWDPRLKQFRSWTFDSEGGFSEAVWSRDPGSDRWIAKSTGVLKDGRTVSATNILTRSGRDVVRWASVDRTLGGAALPDSETITLVRQPPAPRAVATSPASPTSKLPGSKP